MAVIIEQVTPHSLCAKKGILPGDALISLNGHDINDFLDYQFYSEELCLRVIVKRKAGGFLGCVIRKEPYESIGLEFADYMMDDTRHCTNRCVFCFVDQMPKGMRSSLYVKDDDARMSFLFGNYITLTNLSEKEIDRIITMRISPLNVSVHATNPALRREMMGNRFAGECLSLLKRFAKAKISLNCQLVLCPGVNDGEELRRSLADLTALFPAVQSIALVPVGLTRHREGLPTIASYEEASAGEVVSIAEEVAARCLREHGSRLCYLADEFYLRAKRPIPPAAAYESFLQLENGVGMMALLEQEFREALAEAEGDVTPRRVAIATGVDAAPFLRRLVADLQEKFPRLEMDVYAIQNRLFGETITVAGLLTGQDLVAGLLDLPVYDALLLPDCMLRHGEDVFLDDMTVTDLEQAIGIPVRICPTRGDALLSGLCDGG